MSVKRKTKNIDFSISKMSESSIGFTIKIYRPLTNALGYSKLIQVDGIDHPMTKKELKQLSEHINKFLAGPQ